jgi:hypothetical protein
VGVDPEVDVTDQPYAYAGDNAVNEVDPLGLCTIGDQGEVYPGPCATTGKQAMTAEQKIQTASHHTGILGDIESGVERYDPAYKALQDYDNEYHAAQDGCSFSTVFGFAAGAVVADVEVGAVIDGEGEVADAVDGAGDLTSEETSQIQSVVNKANRPLDVVGSAATGERVAGSDIDYTVSPSSWSYFDEYQNELPGLDSHGILQGTPDGPSIHFEPEEPGWP